MNSFEFMYGNEWYKYENNRIMKKDGFDYFDFFIPVHVNIDLNKFDKPDAQNIAAAIVHAYKYGHATGEFDKAKEIRRCLKIDD